MKPYGFTIEFDKGKGFKAIYRHAEKSLYTNKKKAIQMVGIYEETHPDIKFRIVPLYTQPNPMK
jgi:hypothetical protein